jgi:hypothetical protein
MAPEHMRGQAVDRRADIYSVSVVLHELLTGRKLFTRDTVVATMLAVEQGAVHPPSSVVGSLPEGLDEIVLKGLERTAELRFPDARTMAAALDRVLAGLPEQEPLEAFVEAELHQERTQHRSWLQQVLSGDPISPADDQPSAASNARSQPDPLTTPQRPSRSRSAAAQPGSSAVHPLVDHTTLVPSGAEASEQVAAVQHASRNMTAWVVIAALSLAGGFVGYRFAFDTDAPSELEIVRVPPEQSTVEAEIRDDRPEKLVAVVGADNSTRALTTTASAAQIAETETDTAEHVAEKTHPHKLPHHHTPTKKKAVGATPVREETREPAARPPIEAAKPEGSGFVTVGSQPYALVRIDGQEVGATPIMRRKLHAGTHTIELVRPDTGEVRLKKSVTLKDGDHERITIP